MKKLIIQYKDFIFKVHANKDSTYIQDSYKVKGIDDMWSILWKIRYEVEDSNMAINKRGIWSMIHEWRVHNLLYSLGIKRNRTASVDLNTDQSWYIKLGYKVLSIFYFYF